MLPANTSVQPFVDALTELVQAQADTAGFVVLHRWAEILERHFPSQLPGADPKGTTINCNEAWVKNLDEDPVPLISLLRLLQGLRSTGAAHPRSKDWRATLVRTGLDTLQPDEQFVKVVDLTAGALDALAILADGHKADTRS
ncbi:hypothetical protein [Streptomyces sp. NPDC058092]|uniref:hypothetical protein n=1 Tax=Streptomyces sp. NPDC058092 TaxID=3346336 RepID=UPI0036EB10D4